MNYGLKLQQNVPTCYLLFLCRVVLQFKKKMDSLCEAVGIWNG